MEFEVVNIEAVPSTNNYLFNLVGEKDLEEGLVINTDNQTAGKGLGENKWESQVGKNLTFSILLKPDFIKAEDQFVITQIVSLAIWKVCKEKLNTESLKIKWPNDIYVGNKKLAGILVQNIIKGNSISHSIIGIGLNTNQEEFVSDAPNPISMIQLLKMPLERDSLLKEILREINNNYTAFMSTHIDSLLNNNYIENLFRMGETHFYGDKNSRFEGKIIGVDKYGQLRIKKSSGDICIYAYKEVEFVL